MAITDIFTSLSTTNLILYGLVSLPILVVLVPIVSYLVDPYGIRWVPGPLLAALSDFWLVWTSVQGHRSETVHALHEKYGKFVRLAPNHVSVADADAIQVVYAHGNGALKSDFYDAFVSLTRGLFNTRDRAQHTRKRKIVAHIFSQKNVNEFEPHVKEYVGQLIKKWDEFYDKAVKNEEGTEGQGGWRGKDGRLWLDCLPWYNYLAFDIIGDLAFGAPFGMISACKDAAQVATSHEEAIAAYGSSKAVSTHAIPAVQILNDRGEFSASLGCVPPRLRALAVRIPWFARGKRAVHNLAGIAVAAVSRRLTDPTDRVDLLSKLQQGKDETGQPMGRQELTAEALTQLIAGSDTTSNSSCAITYFLAHNPRTQAKLQKELDDALGPADAHDPVTSFDAVKHLPYLEAVIDEGLRLHSTSGIGLPRIAPPGGVEVCGRRFAEGAVLSVPSYTVHRDEGVWGPDAEEYRPERWLEGDQGEMQKAFNVFSFGPRACVGRNVASMELLIIISSILRRFDFVLEEPEKPLETREGFLRKPLQCKVGIRRRNI